MRNRTREYLNKYNDYSCIDDTLCCGEIYHYTASIPAVKGIVSGCFWFTNIEDFRKNKTDENEGVLILEELQNWINNDSNYKTIADDVNYYIGCRAKRELFVSNHETFVLSLCPNPVSKYLWDNYATTTGYMIHFDYEKFIQSLYFIARNGQVYSDETLFKHRKIIYDTEKHLKIMKNDLDGLLEVPLLELPPRYFTEECINHIMFVGNFFKTDCFDKEEEYRVLVNLHYGNDKCLQSLPEQKFDKHSGKHYIEVRFDPYAIKEIVCRCSDSCERLKEALGGYFHAPIVCRKGNFDVA